MIMDIISLISLAVSLNQFENNNDYYMNPISLLFGLFFYINVNKIEKNIKAFDEYFYLNSIIISLNYKIKLWNYLI